MIYDIQSKSDFSDGMKEVIVIPEADVDYNALYTVQEDFPNFIVPFRYRSVDGQMEFTYQIRDRNKLKYRFGQRTPQECVDFWVSVLQPFIDCSDWFLSPEAFVLDTNYMYLNKDGVTISYLYVPTKKKLGDQDSLRAMVSELSQKNPASALDMENKILRSIMQDFQPKAFLQMLRETQHSSLLSTGQDPVQSVSISEKPKTQPSQYVAPVVPEQPRQNSQPSDGIVIDLPTKPSPSQKHGLFGRLLGQSGSKKEKADSKNGTKELVLGAASAIPSAASGAPASEADAAVNASVIKPPIQQSDETILEDGSASDGSACLRLSSAAPLPPVIQVKVCIGQCFTIGRFDVTAGRKQSDFEFEANTTAVSRHHAAIERNQDGAYQIVDLSSKAGTFVNGIRLPPNVPYQLARGSRVSFGTAGADYIWEA